MPVADDGAALYVYSTTLSAAAVTDLLRLSPTFVAEKGAPRLSTDGKPTRGHAKTRGEAVWAFSVDADEMRAAAPDDDSAGFASISELIRVFETRTPILEQLRDGGGCNTRIWWHGSATGQGEFVLPIEILSGLTALGCDLFGNLVSIDEE